MGLSSCRNEARGFYSRKTLPENPGPVFLPESTTLVGSHLPTRFVSDLAQQMPGPPSSTSSQPQPTALLPPKHARAFAATVDDTKRTWSFNSCGPQLRFCSPLLRVFVLPLPGPVLFVSAAFRDPANRSYRAIITLLRRAWRRWKSPAAHCADNRSARAG